MQGSRVREKRLKLWVQMRARLPPRQHSTVRRPQRLRLMLMRTQLRAQLARLMTARQSLWRQQRDLQKMIAWTLRLWGQTALSFRQPKMSWQLW